MNKAEQRKLLEKLTNEFLESGGKINKVPPGMAAIAEDAAYWAGFATDSGGDTRWDHEREDTDHLEDLVSVDLRFMAEREQLELHDLGDVLEDDYSEDSFA